ncbi:hypothetical protein FIA58_016295 [Flavobacterium jejuense]|uniref:Uncharacterized protein n=1 Tax=Flavobacterium jejuense TaxID=1544455 RepID=A0ABX0IWP5_9FLAO|nr:hypothetical protein [Flavobacterium jejuense]NHN27244.1 hypothetical protein [Flavobacterium jejuense]
MKAIFTIEKVSSLTEIPNYWSKEDYFALLKAFDVPVADTLSNDECIEYLQMAVSELEPNQAAQILLTYKLSAFLNENQIEQISNDMLIDKISEEYPEIGLHLDLFSINQLLFKLYNGKFPNTKAILIEVLVEIEDYSEVLTKEEIIKYIMEMTSERNVIKRLFSEKLEHNTPFEEANDIIWKLEHSNDHYKIYTSEYWIADEEIEKSKIETEFISIDVLGE